MKYEIKMLPHKDGVIYKRNGRGQDSPFSYPEGYTWYPQERVIKIRNENYWDRYHMHVLSDEPVIVGDWVIYLDLSDPFICILEGFMNKGDYKKIIASTDEFGLTNFPTNIPDGMIESYCALPIDRFETGDGSYYGKVLFGEGVNIAPTPEPAKLYTEAELVAYMTDYRDDYVMDHFNGGKVKSAQEYLDSKK